MGEKAKKELEEAMKKLHGELIIILGQVKGFQEQIEKLQQENEIQKDTISQLQKDKKKCEEDMTKLHGEFKTILAQVEDLNKQIYKIMEEKKRQEEAANKKIKKLENDLKICRSQSGPCPGGYEEVSGRCIKLHHETLTWEDAKKACEKEKSKLLMPKDK